MNTWKRNALMLALALLAGAALVAVTRATPGSAPLAQGGAPTVVSYQGEVWTGSPLSPPAAAAVERIAAVLDSLSR